MAGCFMVHAAAWLPYSATSLPPPLPEFAEPLNARVLLPSYVRIPAGKHGGKSSALLTHDSILTDSRGAAYLSEHLRHS
jgi:hypothetical protein